MGLLSDYRYDLMQSAIDALDAHWAEEAEEMSERATYAAGGELHLSWLRASDYTELAP